MTGDEALMRERAGSGRRPVARTGARDRAGRRDADGGGRAVGGGRVLVMRGGAAVDLSDVRAVVEAMGEEDELYALQWSEMLSWLRMASAVVSGLGGSMRRHPDETPDGAAWTVMSTTE